MGRIRRAVEKNLLGTPITAEYRASRPLSLSSWFGANGWGPFTLMIVDEMRRDPIVSMAIGQSDAPLYLSEFEVTCDNPTVKKYVEETLDDIWQKSLGTILEAVPYGYACSEVMYKEEGGVIKFDSLKHLHPRDTVPFVYKGKLAYALVGSALMATSSEWNQATQDEDNLKTFNHGGIKLRASRDNLPGKCLWSVYKAQYNPWYGQAAMMPIWWPWRLKTMPDGALENLSKFAYKHTYSGMLARAPDEFFQDYAGQAPVWAQDFMRQLGEQIKTGANVCLPNRMDASGKNYAYTIESYSKIDGSMTQLLDWPDWLDRMITRGMDIPDEIIMHQGNTGGYSRSQVAYTAYFIGRESRRNRILESIDAQIIRPSVNLNFGKTMYTIKGKPLRPPEAGVPQPGQAPAGMPGAEGVPPQEDLLTGNSAELGQEQPLQMSQRFNYRQSHEMTPRRRKALVDLARVFVNGAARAG